MRALLTFLIVAAVGAMLASIVQATGAPSWAAFMLGFAYLLIVSLVINTGAARRSRTNPEIAHELRCMPLEHLEDVGLELAPDHLAGRFSEHSQPLKAACEVATDPNAVGSPHRVVGKGHRPTVIFEGNSFEDAVFVGLSVEADRFSNERAAEMMLHENLISKDSPDTVLGEREHAATAAIREDRT